MRLTQSQINKEAKETINSIFYKVWESKDKEVWKNFFTFLDKKILELETGDRGKNMFVYWAINKIMCEKFGKLFVKNKVCSTAK